VLNTELVSGYELLVSNFKCQNVYVAGRKTNR